PFERDTPKDPLVDGLVEELISHLGSIQTEKLGVIARSSVVRYGNNRPPVREIARELNVKYLVEGTARRDQDRVRVTARLVNTADQAVAWTESYEDSGENLFRIEQDSAARITAAVLTRLFPKGVMRAGTFHVTDRAAYEAYRTARTLQHSNDRERSIEFFEEATRLDPKYADAYSGLAETYLGFARSGRAPEKWFPLAA